MRYSLVGASSPYWYVKMRTTTVWAKLAKAIFRTEALR
jgi:hypothetical protein